jgi:hypothetical protein
MELSDARRLKGVEDENRQLKRIVGPYQTIGGLTFAGHFRQRRGQNNNQNSGEFHLQTAG